MPLSSAQICALAAQIAKTPGFTSQSGQFLNAILSDLCQQYDLATAREVFNFNFSTAAAAIGNLNASLASGPITLPSDYLRAKRGDIMWFNSGEPFLMTPVDIEEFDALTQQPGLMSYPTYWVTDMGQTPPVAYVWPPASGAYPAMVRYYSQKADILTPENSADVPWFPNQQYLITAVAGRLMQIAGDDRWEAFLSDNEEIHPGGAGVILRKYLTMKDDSSNRAKRVYLDPRRFGASWSSLPKSKILGW